MRGTIGNGSTVYIAASNIFIVWGVKGVTISLIG